jgi:hypothetical protein
MFEISAVQVERALLAQLSGSTSFPPSLLEKDYVLTATLQAIFTLKPGTGAIQFGGGTSLVKAWRLPARLSEDIDLKYTPHLELSRRKQNQSFRQFRTDLRAELLGLGLELVLETGGIAPSEFYSFHFSYTSKFASGSTVDPLVRVECRREALLLNPEVRAIHSLADEALAVDAEALSLACTRPEEISAQKLWIVLGDLEKFEANRRDFRHLFDLWQLSGLGVNQQSFAWCFREVCVSRGQRKFSDDFWRIAKSQVVRESFVSELVGLTPYLPEYSLVLEALEHFEALLENQAD